MLPPAAGVDALLNRHRVVERLPKPPIVGFFVRDGRDVHLIGIGDVPFLGVIHPVQIPVFVVDNEGLRPQPVGEMGHHQRHHVVFRLDARVIHASLPLGKADELNEPGAFEGNQPAPFVQANHPVVGQHQIDAAARLHAQPDIIVNPLSPFPLLGSEGRPNPLVGVRPHDFLDPRDDPIGFGFVDGDVHRPFPELGLVTRRFPDSVRHGPVGVGLEHRGHQPLEGAVVQICYS